MRHLNPGLLKDLIKFARPTNSQLANGDTVQTLTEYLETYAFVEERSGGYSVQAGKVNSEAVIKVVVRYRPMGQDYLKVGDRVTWRGRSWVLTASPVVDRWRTSISMEATLDMGDSLRET
jgi:head-tail adaptor